MPSPLTPTYTHISIILDRTGSMESIRDDTIGGFNAFLHEQQSLPEQATLTFVQFDSRDPYEVIHHFRPIRQIPDLTRATFVPRAQTPLFDAIGRGINDLEKNLNDLPESAKPDRIVMVIITDGQENASKEFSPQQVQKMITEKQKADWQFVFLSADLEAINQAIKSGFRDASSMTFDKTTEGSQKAWAAASRGIASYRHYSMDKVEFTEADRTEQESERKRKR
ncbi:MAG: vWA domain-containing protein [Cyanobacteriota bacterium]|nr:vWA domain-containing protein [Cyanobacteriota bacterium]